MHVYNILLDLTSIYDEILNEGLKEDVGNDQRFYYFLFKEDIFYIPYFLKVENTKYVDRFVSDNGQP